MAIPWISEPPPHRTAKRRSIEAAAGIEARDAHRQLTKLLTKWEMMGLELQTVRKVHQIDLALYEVAVLYHEAARLAPSAFLPKQKAFLESELGLMRKEMEVRNLEGDIPAFAHF